MFFVADPTSMSASPARAGTTVGTPLDVSLQNLRLELLYPADEATARWFAESVTA